MSTSVEPQTPSSGTSPSATSPSPAASGGTQAASSPEPFRYGADAPAWAQGKTASEVLGIAEQQNSVIRSYINTGPPPQQPQPQQPYTNQYGSYVPPVQQDPGFNQTEYVTGADIQRLAPKLIQDAVNPQLTAVIDMTAQGNLAHVQRDNAAIFQKYGPEVNIKLANVPKNLWTVDNLRTVVNLVKADHVEELASEIASQRFAGLGAELRSNGSPTPPVAQPEPKNTLQSNEIPQDWKDRAAKAGLTEQTVDEWCRANEISREQFYSTFGNTVITEVSRKGGQ
jgi:hypothetical protein